MKPEGNSTAYLLNSENVEQLCKRLDIVTLEYSLPTPHKDKYMLTHWLHFHRYTQKKQGLYPQYDLCKNILIVPNWELPKYPSTD